MFGQIGVSRHFFPISRQLEIRLTKHVIANILRLSHALGGSSPVFVHAVNRHCILGMGCHFLASAVDRRLIPRWSIVTDVTD
jgi:hypothetical protein